MTTLYNELLDNASIIQEDLARFGYPKFHINFVIESLKPGVAGLALLSHIEKIVKLSSDYLREYKEETITKTLAHEICHHYVFHYFPLAKQHHGPEFRFLMNKLGFSGDTYHKMRLENSPNKSTRTKTRYIYVTITSNIEVLLTSKQHLLNHRYSYKGEKLIYTGKIKQYK